MIYGILTGNLTQTERDTLTNVVYNSPKNLYGDLISVLFVSDVAYSGVNFLNTQNIMILSRITNISKWKQVYARIIRTGSHNMLKDKEKYAKVYTFVINIPKETERFPKFEGKTFEELVYKKNELSNVEIDKFINNLSKVCISEKLLNSPASYRPSSYEMNVSNKLLLEDIEREMKNIILRIFVSYPSSVWETETLIKRIQDPQHNLIYFNMSKIPDIFIRNFIHKNPTILAYKYPNSEESYIASLSQRKEKQNFNIIPFEDFKILADKTSINKGLIDQLCKSRTKDKYIFSSKLLRRLNKDFSILSSVAVFWKFMYDIGNEYYADDETNFISNHSTLNRDFSKMAGCYFNTLIVLKDGSSKTILYSFPILKNKPAFSFIFKISCFMLSDNAPYYLHVKIVRFHKDESNIDQRHVFKGIACFSSDLSDVYDKFPTIDKTINKKDYCIELIYKVCDLQLKTEEKIVYTPFEK
jgi:hypothetical protein